jgi:hypothetical protein
MALIFLRQSAPAQEAAPPPSFDPADVLAIDEETLHKWAGKPTLRKATQALVAGLPVEFEEAGTLLVRFSTWNIVCRWLPGGGLSGMVCSCHAPGPCVHRVAAVLAYQTRKGVRQLAEEEAALEAAEGAARTRPEVLASVGVVLREMVGLGLSRLSRATVDRLRTLAISAHGVDLPRLERMLAALADEAAMYLGRNAQAATAGLLTTAARIEALRCALDKPTPALVGVHRSHYEKVGDIELIGMGARQWRTRSGYAGLTVYFWDRSLKNWATWTETRPAAQGGFDPVARYQQDGPWTGCGSPHEACRHQLRLMGTFRNRAGRLSGRPGTRCMMQKASNPREVPCAIGRWAELLPRAAALYGGGLCERSEMDEIVLLTPQSWGQAQFDQVRQELVRPIIDSAGDVLPLVLPHTPENAHALETLEQHDPATTHGLLGLVRLRAEQLAVEPLTLYSEKKLVNLTLDGALPTGSAPASGPAAPGEEDEPAEGDEDAAASTSPLGALLTRMADSVEAVAEGGVRSVPDIEEVRRLSVQADSVGLSVCAQALARLADRLDEVRKSLHGQESAAAETLLRAYYLVGLAAAQEVIVTATAGIAHP